MGQHEVLINNTVKGNVCTDWSRRSTKSAEIDRISAIFNLIYVNVRW
jgi:hypothetical protein